MAKPVTKQGVRIHHSRVLNEDIMVVRATSTTAARTVNNVSNHMVLLTHNEVELLSGLNDSDVLANLMVKKTFSNCDILSKGKVINGLFNRFANEYPYTKEQLKLMETK